MRIVRVRTADGDRPGLVPVDADEITLLGPDELDWALTADPAERSARAAEPGAPRIPLAGAHLLAPVPRPPKFLAIGLNYAAHVAETGRERPDLPLFFNKQSTCVVGPGEAIEIPRVSEQVDFEGELGMVIGRRCRDVPAAEAHSVVAGYVVVNDVSVRDWQRRSPTMTLGKSFDTHGPIGPWIVTADEVGDPAGRRLRTWVNEELMQDGNTADMITDCGEQIELLSTVCTLEVGDVIATGTPSGVGVARDPQVWLRDGDVVRIEIDGIGTLENPVVGPR